MSTSEIIKLTFPGEAISKSNSTMARFNFKTKKSEVYIPEKFILYEELLRSMAIEQMTLNNYRMFLDGPVVMTINYYLSTKRKKDLPNLPKTTCDALNEVAYADDTQIVESHLYKYYDKVNPRVEVILSRPPDWKSKILLDVWSLPDACIDESLKTKRTENIKREKAEARAKAKANPRAASKPRAKVSSTRKTNSKKVKGDTGVANKKKAVNVKDVPKSKTVRN